jgi:hypothetical protein
VLRTRPPLGPRRSPVRLACVKRAASVRPEPGSNSPIAFEQLSHNETLMFRSELFTLSSLRRSGGSDAPSPRVTRVPSNAHPQPMLSNQPPRAFRSLLSYHDNRPVSPGPLCFAPLHFRGALQSNPSAPGGQEQTRRFSDTPPRRPRSRRRAIYYISPSPRRQHPAGGTRPGWKRPRGVRGGEG